MSNDREWQEAGDRVIAAMREKGMTGRVVTDLYSCDDCGEKLRYVGVPFDGMLDFCPECGEARDGILMRVLVEGDPIVLSEGN